MRISTHSSLLALCAAVLISACAHLPAENKTSNSNTHEQAARASLAKYAKQTYGRQLSLTTDELKQLTWVLDNPFATPEMATKKNSSVNPYRNTKSNGTFILPATIKRGF